MARLQQENSRLTTELAIEKHSGEEKTIAFDNAQKQLTETFHVLSSEALQRNNEQFLRLAQENFKQHQLQAGSELQQKENAFAALIKPINDALQKTEAQIHAIEKERKESYGSLTQHLESMAQTQQSLQNETRNLVQALRRPEVRGQWGEMTLRRLAELAGMVDHCDFYEQEHTATSEGAMRPDMIVRMPAGREIVIDVKTPLDAYLSAMEANTEAERERHLARHARNVRERIKELASKGYWNQFEKSPDFVVLFIPGDQFLSAALNIDRSLLEDALKQQVILATPTSLVALLRAVAYGWRQQSLAENAEIIRKVGEDLYKRLATFSGHLNKLGKNLGTTLEHYNKAVGSFDRQVVPGARKFTELGISSAKPMESVEPIDKLIKPLNHDP
ncbi:MAG: DNA recombination protein RmuC [Gammaproteobacteria bacterium]|nr:DNA recombination protein RmuC [Gammaproteobacteria bacterium]